jgi:predicted glutamine amidotransferase
MCRFVLYLGPPVVLSSLITEPENSLIHQSFDSREGSEPLNGDGFGLVWYRPEISADAAQFRFITPAWSNQNLIHLARMTRSGCVLAHVRAASTNLAVTETNTHPFVAGRYAFMHNGEIGGFRDIKRSLLDDLGTAAFHSIDGTTDSEHLFALFYDSLAQEPDDSANSMAHALEVALARLQGICRRHEISDCSLLNIALANGTEAVACRYSVCRDGESPSLHIHTGKSYACPDGISCLVEPGDEGHSVIVSSEPLTDDETWSMVPDKHMVIIDRERQVEIREMDLP